MTTENSTPKAQYDNPFTPYYKLILFYLLSPKHTKKWGLEDFPRNPLYFIQSEEWKAVHDSDNFNFCVDETWAESIWRHMGIKAPRKSFSRDDSIYVLVHQSELWAWIMETFLQLSSKAFYYGEPDQIVPVQDDEALEVATKMIAKYIRGGTKFDEIVDIVHEHRDFADFNTWYRTNYLISFHRKYYHTRTRFKHIALDDANGEHEQVAEVNFDIEDVDTPDWLEHFFHRLGRDNDIEIVKLLYAGLTQDQIAKRLGYANHSGVNKRIGYIREEMRHFLAEQEKAVYHPPEPKPSTVKYDVIPFSYKRTQ